MKNTRIMTIMGLVAILVAGVVFYTGCPFNSNTKGAAKDNQQTQENSSGTVKASEAAITYVCPMHPDQTSTDPNAKCPKCGMNLEPVKDANAAPVIYGCPMHPEQHSTNPDDKCSICGMKYEQVK